MSITPAEALQFVESVPIVAPPPSSGLESVSVAPAFTGNDQAVVVGSQLAEFTSNVPQSLRAPISNSLLLAQLAANKSVEAGGSTRDWYAKYLDVLTSIGWVMEQGGAALSEVSGTSAEVHEEIIPLVTAALGGAAAAALIVPLLEGLEGMDDDSPWITIFERESQRVQANQFQITHVHAPDGAAPKMVMVLFGLEARRSIVQVLFFKVSDDDAVFTHGNAHLSIDPGVFDEVAPALARKVGEYAATYVADVEI